MTSAPVISLYYLVVTWVTLIQYFSVLPLSPSDIPPLAEPVFSGNATFTVEVLRTAPYKTEVIVLGL